MQCHSHVGRTAPGPSVRQSHGLTVRRYGFCTKMSHSIKNALSMLAPRSDWGSMHDCLLASYWQRQSFTLKLLGSFAGAAGQWSQLNMVKPAASGGRRRDRSVKIRLFLCQWVVHDKCANWMRDLNVICVHASLITLHSCQQLIWASASLSTHFLLQKRKC